MISDQVVELWGKKTNKGFLPHNKVWETLSKTAHLCQCWIQWERMVFCHASASGNIRSGFEYYA